MTLVNPFMSFPAAGGGSGGFPETDLWVRYEALLETSYSDGDQLTTVTDFGPRGFDLTATTGPTYETNVVNGQPVFQFPVNGRLAYDAGSAGYFPDHGTLGTAAPNITIAVVASSAGAEATSREWLFGISRVNTDILFLTEGDTSSEWGAFWRTTGGTDQPATSGVDTRDWTALMMTFDGDDWALYRDGTLVTSGTRTGTFMWRDIEMGDHAAAIGRLGGWIALGAIWETDLDSTARGEFFDYATDTYGTP